MSLSHIYFSKSIFLIITKNKTNMSPLRLPSDYDDTCEECWSFIFLGKLFTMLDLSAPCSIFCSFRFFLGGASSFIELDFLFEPACINFTNSSPIITSDKIPNSIHVYINTKKVYRLLKSDWFRI